MSRRESVPSALRQAPPLTRRLLGDRRSSVSTAMWDCAQGKGGGMSINTYRGLLYKLARILGDVNAVQKGKIGRRVARRAVGKLTGRGLGKLFR
jgi:hypothetical protein